MLEQHHRISHYLDDDHVFIDGRQFISLKRVNAIRADLESEMEVLNDEVYRLEKENDAYRVLLKEDLK